ncbi:hypothetical protein TA3x_005543 [Tundrisphaera sp. TA3]|uniref:hypothetical protein n=1 Tax=Tundrisphaera sp. TA3 TaxID=3435775 RepID=UPI003EB9970F
MVWPLLPQVYQTIRRADEIVVYEGLPHHAYEQELFEEERKVRPIVMLSDFPFYREPLAMKAEDVATLRDLIGARGTYAGISSNVEKTCGGFHPDFAVEWSVEGKVTRCLICFGCFEARFVDPEGARSFYDLKTERVAGKMRAKLMDLLKAYRKNRPPHERFGLHPIAMSSR